MCRVCLIKHGDVGYEFTVTVNSTSVRVTSTGRTERTPVRQERPDRRHQQTEAEHAQMEELQGHRDSYAYSYGTRIISLLNKVGSIMGPFKMSAFGNLCTYFISTYYMLLGSTSLVTEIVHTMKDLY
jgi:hypothetical protein